MSSAQWAEDFARQTGVPLDVILQPISTDSPCGPTLASDPLYREIKTAREQDDASVPQGVWAHELKRADWAKVQQLALNALRARSKDLQLALWLLEASFELRGFDGLAPGVLLVTRLCEQFWDGVHPTREADEGERRANLLYAAGRKLLPRLRLTTVCGAGDQVFTWADWMRARRTQQLAASGVDGADQEEPSLSQCENALRATPSETLAASLLSVRSALASLAHFRATVEALPTEFPLTWGEVPGLLSELERFFAAELGQRRYKLPAEAQGSQEAVRAPSPGSPALGTPVVVLADDEVPPPLAPRELVTARARAYSQLAEIAQLLAMLDPHSPTPYLLERAIAWGKLSTSQLYHELFIKGQGQLSIFELMGLEAKTEG